MKVIKVGSSAQSRIAQACDRCRSKKIRCDGIRPSCTQCVNVGFECKTSDKLSRRAFPRGYTESLEERVRALEAEVRELKELLDEKDEKIDMLSRIHSHSPQAHPGSRKLSSPSPSESEPEKDDTFKVQQTAQLLDDEKDSFFVGSSSGRTLVGRCRQLTVLENLRLIIYRGIQAESPRDWPVVLRPQLECILRDKHKSIDIAFAETNCLVQGAAPSCV